MANILRADKQRAVTHLLMEGNSIRATERITGVHRDTIMRLIIRVGGRCQDLLDEKLRNLNLTHIQVDELWTFVGKKAARIPVEEKRENALLGDQYIWVALDEPTKLIPTFAVGKRTADNARRFLKDLAGRLVMQTPHESDPHAFQAGGYKPTLKLSSDGFWGYSEAVDLAFGPNVLYGQLIKDYRNADMKGRYAPGELIGADRRCIFGDFDPFDICTSHVERTNLTFRTFVKRLVRLTICFSKKLENLCAAIAMHVAYYNFAWRPRMPGKSGRRRLPPALAAGVTDQLWSVNDLLDVVVRMQ